MTKSDWARREIEIFSREQDGYGCMCAESALKAFLSLCVDGHSGFSFGVTKGLLERLMGGLPLKPIEDKDFFDQNGMVGQSQEFLDEMNLKSDLQCRRMPSLFRYESKDGKVTYCDIDRVICYDEEEYEKRIAFSSGEADRIVDKMFPIQMPYWPSKQKYIVMFRDGKPIWVKTPEGERIDL